MITTNCVHCFNLIEFKQGFWRSTNGTITCPARAGGGAHKAPSLQPEPRGKLCVHCLQTGPHLPNCIVTMVAARDERDAAREQKAPVVVADLLREPSQKDSALQFVAKHNNVLQGSARVAVAVSKTFAKRIAKALNEHVPNREGV